jgi:uncharacterized protein (DUF2236 family)
VTGRPYRADDPHLLTWLHVAEVDSFLRCHQRYGARPLTPSEADEYVADAALVAGRLGVPDPPVDCAELALRIESYRPELAGTREARQAARFLLLRPPLPYAARALYAVLAAVAVSDLPAWSRWPLRLPYLPVSEAIAAPAAGQAIMRAARWILSARSAPGAPTLNPPGGRLPGETASV